MQRETRKAIFSWKSLIVWAVNPFLKLKKKKKKPWKHTVLNSLVRCSMSIRRRPELIALRVLHWLSVAAPGIECIWGIPRWHYTSKRLKALCVIGSVPILVNLLWWTNRSHLYGYPEGKKVLRNESTILRATGLESSTSTACRRKLTPVKKCTCKNQVNNLTAMHSTDKATPLNK